MAIMPCLQKQNPNKTAGGHNTCEFPAVLPKMQTGNADKCPTTEYCNYQRARRKDAEPITCENIIVIGSVLFIRKIDRR